MVLEGKSAEIDALEGLFCSVEMMSLEESLRHQASLKSSDSTSLCLQSFPTSFEADDPLRDLLTFSSVEKKSLEDSLKSSDPTSLCLKSFPKSVEEDDWLRGFLTQDQTTEPANDKTSEDKTPFLSPNSISRTTSYRDARPSVNTNANANVFPRGLFSSVDSSVDWAPDYASKHVDVDFKEVFKNSTGNCIINGSNGSAFPSAVVSGGNYVPEEALDACIASVFESNATLEKINAMLPLSSEAAVNLGSHSGSWQKIDWGALYNSGLPEREHRVPVAPAIQENGEAKKEGTVDVPDITKSASETPKRKRKRTAMPEPEVMVFVDEPADDDVLLGRGGKTNNYRGNRRYLEEKTEMQKRYLAASKVEKTVISQELVDRVQKRGGRFLKLDERKRWYVVHNTVARKKCSQALREINTPQVRANKRAKYNQKRKMKAI